MLVGRYELPLVLVSILVAILASYTALSLAERITKSSGTTARWWILGGAVAMGTAIWAMHFIGMLAFRLPIPVGYDFVITFLSWLLPILASGMALWLVSQPQLPLGRLAGAAVLMGAGINAMHYTGMAALRMQPGIIYDPALFLASVAIAVIASAAALWIAFTLRQNVPHVWLARTGAATVMGVAIAGMHYTGMAAASFPAGSVCLAAQSGFSQDGLAVMVIIATFSVLAIALLTSVYDARLESRSQILALSQATAEERQALLTREREARTQAERMSDLKDEFLATLSHELRTPLNAVLGWAQLLRHGIKDEATLQNGLDTIERNARAQAQLIDDLLDMSQIISGKVRLNLQWVDPVNVIDAAIDTIGPAALAKSIKIEKYLDLQAPPVAGDPGRLQQVMWNLLSNAVKFTPNGGRIHVRLERAASDIVISVADSGIGIRPEFLPYVFDRFRQADASTTRKYGGLGLGLSIVKNLVELHGGTVHATSQGEGGGAQFTVRFPCIEPQAIDPAQKLPGLQSFQVNPANFKPADLSGISVLVIDDEIDAIALLERILTGCGANVLIATNAKDALGIIKEKQLDILVSDVGMPDMDGFEFIRQVRQLDAGKGGAMPAIALTAFARAEDRSRAEQAGFNAYVSKPFDASQLVLEVARMARKPSMAH